MNAGFLKHRITIQKNQVITDNIGNHTNIWADYKTVWAGITEKTGVETEKSGITDTNISLIFIIRYNKDFKEIDSTNYRITFAGKLYNISYIDHYNYNKTLLKIFCKSVKK